MMLNVYSLNMENFIVTDLYSPKHHSAANSDHLTCLEPLFCHDIYPYLTRCNNKSAPSTDH